MLDAQNHGGQTTSPKLHLGLGPRKDSKGSLARNLAEDDSPLPGRGEVDGPEHSYTGLHIRARVKQGLARTWSKLADSAEGDFSRESSQHGSPLVGGSSTSLRGKHLGRALSFVQQAAGMGSVGPAGRTAGTIERAKRAAEQQDDLTQAHVNLREIQWENVLEVYLSCFGRTYYLRAATDDECVEWVGAIQMAVAGANAQYNEAMGSNKSVTQRVRERMRGAYDSARTEMCIAVLLVANFIVSITRSELGVDEVSASDSAHSST